MGVAFVRDGLSGLVGAVVMVGLWHVPRLWNEEGLDLSRVIVTKVLGFHANSYSQLGLAAHLLVGFVLGVIYGGIFHPFPRFAEVLNGLLYGLILWLGLMTVVMPAVGEGYFGVKLGRSARLSSLASHLVYGLILSAVYLLW
jgi:uncharacterized membrane protein YagU involved in acid resistance